MVRFRLGTLCFFILSTLRFMLSPSKKNGRDKVRSGLTYNLKLTTYNFEFESASGRLDRI